MRPALLQKSRDRFMLFAEDTVLLTWRWLVGGPDERGAVQGARLSEGRLP